MYSLYGNHFKSVLYLKNAIKLNPFNVATWTLLGHEFKVVKSNEAAILAFRQASGKS